MLIGLASLGVGCVVAWCAWWLMSRGLVAWVRYETRVRDETRRTLDASFLFVDMHHIWPAGIGLSILLLVLAFWLGGQWWILPLLVPVLLCLPGLVLGHMRRRRARYFDEQLPDLMQALAGALRAGAGLQPALRHIVAQSPSPLSQEFELLLREQRLGLSFLEALEQLRGRMPTEACALVVSALGIAAQTGGGLADTLEGIGQTLRARQHWLGRVRALTAQGRMQSRLMAALPALMLLVLSRLEPEAMRLLWTTAIGWGVLTIMVALECLGLLWIRRLVDINV